MVYVCEVILEKARSRGQVMNDWDVDRISSGMILRTNSEDHLVKSLGTLGILPNEDIWIA